MTNLPALLTEALQDRKLASRFSHGRFDKTMKVAAERQFAEQAIIKNPEIAACLPASIQTAMLDVAYSGLSLAPSLSHAYLIPYGPICTFAPGYRGLLHLAYKSGAVKSVQVNLVHEHDPEFQVWSDEHGRHLRHIENQRGSPGRVTHAYCIANLTAGGPAIIEVMNEQQLSDVEQAAIKRKKGGMVWRGPFRDEMCKKAVIRRASKLWPKDDGGIMQHMMQVSDQHDGAHFEETPDKEPPEQELCITLDQETALNDVVIENGIAPDVAPQWLARYAKSRGYSSIENMPARLYDDAYAALDARSKEAVSGTK